MKSRLPGFYKMTIDERLALLRDRELISEDEWQMLRGSEQVLSNIQADNMVENVIGVFGLPMGLGLNFLVNGQDYAVPLVVEEPSIVAALSSAAKTMLAGGGFTVETDRPMLIGQVQIVDVPHPSKARKLLLEHQESILNLANSLHPKMVARGGGAKELEVEILSATGSTGDMVVCNLIVDTCDAMGANMVNTMCEGIASHIEELTQGRVFLRILSNLTDRAMVRASCRVAPEHLATKEWSGEEVRDGIILANDFAIADPYRATTHNKGIMNGIDAVAIATGNDWRAIEAAAHAYASRGGRYKSLTRWYKDEDGNLIGELDVPLKVGTVGGSLESNPAVRIAYDILGVSSARELAAVMGAVGLAQNFSAIRALSTTGIQAGHMTLHARSVAMTAGAPAEHFETVVDRLVESGEIKVWKAQEIIAQLGTKPAALDQAVRKSAEGRGYGKVILLGEHAVVYGSHAIAAPISLSVRSIIHPSQQQGVTLAVPKWGVETTLHDSKIKHTSFLDSLRMILDRLAIKDESFVIEVDPAIPRAMGLGGSAALAVSVIRALNGYFQLSLSDEDINGISFEAEKLAHGTPSGIDNTLATFRRFMLYRKGHPPLMKELTMNQEIPIVIGMSGTESLTAAMVGKVEQSWEKNRFLYERLFAEIDGLALEGVKAIERGELEQLGELMNINQGLLNALGVSSWELEEMIQISRQHGALGAKLTGGGGGGSIVAVCPGEQERIVTELQKAGYRAIATTIGGRNES